MPRQLGEHTFIRIYHYGVLRCNVIVEQLAPAFKLFLQCRHKAKIKRAALHIREAVGKLKISKHTLY